LDQKNELPRHFLAELKAKGYSANEIFIYRRLTESQGREQIVLRPACLGQLVCSNNDQMLKDMYEGYFLNLSTERKAYEISFEEIGAMVGDIAPLFGFV